MPLKTAVVGAVRTHWPIRDRREASRFLKLMLQIWMKTPGLPSGVSSLLAVRSIPASAGHIITEVPKPVASRAASIAHLSVIAVIRTLATFIGKPSAKVSSISTPFIFIPSTPQNQQFSNFPQAPGCRPRI